MPKRKEKMGAPKHFGKFVKGCKHCDAAKKSVEAGLKQAKEGKLVSVK